MASKAAFWCPVKRKKEKGGGEGGERRKGPEGKERKKKKRKGEGERGRREREEGVWRGVGNNKLKWNFSKTSGRASRHPNITSRANISKCTSICF